jgi:hypothetical protein
MPTFESRLLLLLSISPQYIYPVYVGLDSWFKGLTLKPKWFPCQCYRLIAKQTVIGWRHLFHGHLSLEWRTKQDYYVLATKNQNTHTYLFGLVSSYYPVVTLDGLLNPMEGPQ